MTPESVGKALEARPAGRKFPWPCAKCRKKAVWPVFVTYRSTVRYEDKLHVVDTPNLNLPRCLECGETVFDNWADEQINRAFREQAHLLTPEQIQANRTALGLSQQELANRLGVEDDLVRRWEENRTIHSRVVDNLLRLYFSFPQVREALNGKPHPELGIVISPEVRGETAKNQRQRIRDMSISATTVKTLRDRTNAPMMDCKAALAEADGDLEKAAEILRKKNKAIQDKKGERETAEGRIAAHIDPAKAVGALVEVRCESAPVAKSEPFVKLADDIARQVALNGADSVPALLAQPLVSDPQRTVNDRIAEVIGLVRENMKPARMVRLTGLLGAYIHHDGSVGAMVQVEALNAGAKAEPQLLKEVCMHITFKDPLAMVREDIAAAVVDKEKEIVKSQIAVDPKNQGKPANIIEKIAEGKMKAWFGENVLLEQLFIKDDSKTVGDLFKAAGLKLVKFTRLKVGELK